MRKRILTAVLVLGAWAFAIGQTTTAADQSSRESVMKFFAAMKIEQQAQQVQDLMMNQVTQSIQTMVDSDPKLSPEQKRKIIDSITPELAFFRTLYPIAEMLQDMAPVYQKHFTDTDFNQIIAFFESPVGQKMLNESPKMMQESMQVIMPKMSARMQTQMAEMQKRIEAKMKQKEEEGKAPAK